MNKPKFRLFFRVGVTTDFKSENGYGYLYMFLWHNKEINGWGTIAYCAINSEAEKALELL